jgi:hypothetical protein
MHRLVFVVPLHPTRAASTTDLRPTPTLNTRSMIEGSTRISSGMAIKQLAARGGGGKAAAGVGGCVCFLKLSLSETPRRYAQHMHKGGCPYI